MNEDLQKIVVLCVFVGAIVFAFVAGIQFQQGKMTAEKHSSVEQKDYSPEAPEMIPSATTSEEGSPAPLPSQPEPFEPVLCTADAKMCPDGSFVGRIGPNCEFAPCPSPKEETGEHICTDTERMNTACTHQYQPVCGKVQVQCIQAPCPPVTETYSNGCVACSQGNVISYTEGACNAYE